MPLEESTGISEAPTDSDFEEVTADAFAKKQKLTEKQMSLAEVTGVITPVECEILLKESTLTNSRKWAMSNWESPEAYEIFQTWATETMRLEETCEAIRYRKYKPGEIMEDLCPCWILARIMYLCWCKNGVKPADPPNTPFSWFCFIKVY